MSTLTQQSLEDTGMTKLEIGHEGTLLVTGEIQTSLTNRRRVRHGWQIFLLWPAPNPDC